MRSRQTPTQPLFAKLPDMPMLTFIARTALLTFLLLMSGCASLTESECRNGDWYGIGYRDGDNGRETSRLGSHTEACAEYAIAPDEGRYRAGYAKGVRSYCEPENGLEQGRRGMSYRGVCPVEMERPFLRAFNAGRTVYDAERRVQELERERSELENRLAKAKDDKERRHLADQLSWVRMRHRDAQGDLREREMWLRMDFR